jgi:putative ABC transport system substrate-binding protein
MRAPILTHVAHPFGLSLGFWEVAANQFRRDFCRWCAMSLVANAVPSLVDAGRRQVLIGLVTTGHNDSTSYAELERLLKVSLPDIAADLKITRREAGFSRQQLLSDLDEVLAMRPDILICLDLNAALAAVERRTNRALPIVFIAHDDPLEYGLIRSYAHPGNNLTGVTTFRCVDGKMVEILAEAFPARKHFGYLLDETVDNARCKRLAQEAAQNRGLRLSIIDVSAKSFIAEMATRLEPMGLDAVVAPASAPIWQNRKSVVDVLNALHLPAIYESELFLNEGGLIYYGPIRTSALAQVALDVRKIMHGEAAGDLAVEQPTLFELVINLHAPHASDYAIRASTLRRADRILQ